VSQFDTAQPYFEVTVETRNLVTGERQRWTWHRVRSPKLDQKPVYQDDAPLGPVPLGLVKTPMVAATDFTFSGHAEQSNPRTGEIMRFEVLDPSAPTEEGTER
jgi:hypothetical protein